MKHPHPPPELTWWTDGTHVLPMTEAEIVAWRERGVAYGWVVIAPDAERARAWGEKIRRHQEKYPP